jgi:hypothetical protein
MSQECAVLRGTCSSSRPQLSLADLDGGYRQPRVVGSPMAAIPCSGCMRAPPAVQFGSNQKKNHNLLI